MKRKSTNVESVRHTILDAAREASKIITDAAALQIKAIADAAGQARTVVIANASEAARIVSEKSIDNSSDHNLLIRIDVKVDGLDTKIKELTTGTATRISALETGKLDVKDSYSAAHKEGVDKIQGDHETRIRDIDDKVKKVMTWGAAGLLGLGIAETLFIVLYK
jgi:hypothetical protein